jgi:hypothetical protein
LNTNLRKYRQNGRIILLFEKGELKGNRQLFRDAQGWITFRKIGNSQSQEANGFGERFLV